MTAASWGDFRSAGPELAATAEERFAAHLHHILATLKADGSPRLSGIEVQFNDVDLWLGMMAGSRKADDLRRDARFALHSAPLDTDLAAADVRVEGRAREVTDPETRRALFGGLAETDDAAPTDGLAFVASVELVVLTRVEGDRLVLDAWRPDRGLTHHERR